MRTNFRLTITVLASAVALPVYAANGHGQQAGAPQTHSAAPPTAHGGSHQTTHVNTTHSSHPATPHTTTHVVTTSHGHAASHQTTRTTSAQHTSHVSTTSGSSHGSHTLTAGTGKSSHGSHTTTATTGKSSHGSKTTAGTSSGTTSSGTSASTTTTSGGTTPLTPLARKISSHPQLAAKVEAMLPMDMTLNQATKGFKNQGQLIAALHVSQNLGIPFEDLKRDMTRRHMSLGQSIQDLKTSANSTTEAHRGEQEADEDVKSSTSSQEREEREELEHRLSLSQQISSNTQLTTKVQALLPSGMTLKQATSGFTSESQFLSALHASKDLGIPFTQIKAEMTGTDHDTLLRAIQEVKPTADAAAAVKTAQTEAAADLQTTTSTSTTSTTTGGGH